MNSSNIASVIGTFNGGGIHVVYDDDGAILANYFGVPPTAVLGITDIEWVANGSPEVLEAWMVLSGPGVRAEDPSGIGFAGVVTHEMGHALNLAHTQANGAALPSNLSDPPQPPGCGAPWTGGPDDSQGETMYPYITPEPGAPASRWRRWNTSMTPPLCRTSTRGRAGPRTRARSAVRS